MTHPGVGALTALSFLLIIGKAERFRCGMQVASYPGLVPLEESSGNRRGGGGASHGAQSAGVVQQVSPPDDATWTEDRQGRDGTETDGSPVSG